MPVMHCVTNNITFKNAIKKLKAANDHGLFWMVFNYTH